MAFTSQAGGYAELAAVEPSSVVPLPAKASFAEGASFLLTFLTAYIPLTRQVRAARRARRCSSTRRAGGVGTATIQVARALGAARVVAAVGSAEKLDVCRELGAEEAYVYDELPEDLQADVVVDPVGGAAVRRRRSPRLRPLGTARRDRLRRGRVGRRSTRGHLVGRNAGVQGFYLGRLMRHNPEIVAAALGELLALWEQGAVKPLVGAELPLAEVEQAHELVESRRSVGKVVLLP